MLLIIIISIFAELLIVLEYLWVRNAKVRDFHHLIIGETFDFVWDTHKEFNEKLKYAEYICDKTPYFRMVFSFKPLTLEKWFTEEEIYFIENHEFKS